MTPIGARQVLQVVSLEAIRPRRRLADEKLMEAGSLPQMSAVSADVLGER